MRRNKRFAIPKRAKPAENLFSATLLAVCCHVVFHTQLYGDEGRRLGPVGRELSDRGRIGARKDAVVLGKRSQWRCMLEPAAGERLGVDDLSVVEAHGSSATPSWGGGVAMDHTLEVHVVC